MTKGKRKPKPVRETGEAFLLDGSWGYPVVHVFVDANKFKPGDLVRVTVTLVKRGTP